MKALLVGLILLTATAGAHDISSQVTWSREVSRLVARHCTSCHHDGGAAFSLTTFQQAQAHAKDMAKTVLDRRMPPFGAVKGFGDLREDQSLTQEQIELVMGWVQGGAPEGDASLVSKTAPKEPAAKVEPKTGAEWVGGVKKLEAETTFIAIRPMTLNGDSIRVVAERPDGTVQPLIWFYHADAKAPRTYYFRKAIKLPAGTKIVTSVPDVTVALLEPAR
jgi:hypothetical protein